MARPYKGPRRFVATRMPVSLFAAFTEHARRRGLNLSETLSLAAAELVERDKEAVAA